MGLIVITAILLGQPGGPDPDKTYKVLINGVEKFGFLVEKGGRYEFTPDTPWIANAKREYPPLDVDYLPESAASREERQKVIAAEDGFAKVGDRWLPKLEVDLAKRAADMAQEVRAQHVPAPADPTDAPPSAVSAPADAPAQPGFLAQWGFHAAIMIVAGVLIGLVVKFAILA